MTETFPPVIDLTSPDAAAAIDKACREVGFIQIVGHGIPQETLDGVFAASDSFFQQPLAEKMRWASHTAEIERGYSAKGTEGLSYSMGLDQPPDLFEAWTVVREWPVGTAPEDPAKLGHHAEPNIWPDGPAGFRETLMDYYETIRKVANRITSLMATALGLAPDFFEPYTNYSLDTMRVNYFEGRPGDTALPNQQGIGEHTDYGIITLLLADQEPALQAYVDDEWKFVVPQPGAILMNVGDLLARWTNDEWRSTLHRVVPVLTSGDKPRIRRSVPYFHEGNVDAVVETLPSCITAENPAKYGPITVGEHILAKMLAGRLLEAADAENTLGDRMEALGR